MIFIFVNAKALFYLSNLVNISTSCDPRRTLLSIYLTCTLLPISPNLVSSPANISESITCSYSTLLTSLSSRESLVFILSLSLFRRVSILVLILVASLSYLCTKEANLVESIS